MDYRQEQINYEWRQLFPKMQPVRKAPAMFTLNGFGLSVYGKRDVHIPTGSYIKTHCICALFIPLFALGAYRVLDAEGGGWYFLGKESLSGFAKGWNILMLATVLTLSGVGIWNAQYNSVDARATRLITKAEQAQQQGKYADATDFLTRVYYGRSSKRLDAMKKLEALHRSLPSMPIEQAVRVVPSLLEAQERSAIQPQLPRFALRDTFALVHQLVQKQGDTHPTQAIKLLNAVAALAPNPQVLQQQKYTLLVKAVAKEPNNLDMVSELALIYEKRKAWDQCQKLLEPVRHQLRTQEGARILGQWYVRKGMLRDAYALLLPYTQERLRSLHQAERQFEKTYTQVRERAIRDLRYRRAPSSFYTTYFRSLPKAERHRRIGAYLEERAKQDPTLRKARQALIATARIVPVAMDLGIVMLYRARSMKDAGARQKELQEAERIFLSIRGIAGKTTRYQLYLGQVYFWMGKSYEGQKLFDRVLQQTQRRYDVLMQLTTILRELGEHHRAQRLVEEAYRKAKTPKEKYGAAYIRAISYSTLEDQLLWLKRSDPESPLVEISLNTARGDLARQKGDYREAARFMQQAIKSYAQVPKSSVNLNNRALVHFSLFRVTGDRKEFQTGIQLLEEALALRPSDGIMLGNTALFLFQEAVVATLGKSIDWRYVNQSMDVTLLSYFYQDEAGKNKYVQALHQQPSYQKAMQRYQKLLILSPKSSRAYRTLLQTHWDTKHEQGLQELLQRLRSAKIYFSNPSQYADTPANLKADRETLVSTKTVWRQQQRLVQQLRNRSRVDFALAATALLGYETALFSLGEPVNWRTHVQLAAQVNRRYPCSATRRAYVRALLASVADRLAQKDARFERILNGNKRFLMAGTLLAFALEQDTTMLRWLQKDREFQQAVRLIEESVQGFSDHAYAYEWSLLRAVSSQAAQTVADRLQKSPLHQYNQKIQAHLSPDSPYTALDLYFRALIRGYKKPDHRIFPRFTAWGVPLPSLEMGVIRKQSYGTVQGRPATKTPAMMPPERSENKGILRKPTHRKATFLDSDSQ